MKETTLLKTALIAGIIGLVALYLISLNLNPQDYTPLSKNGDDVILKGTITKISENENAIMVEILQQEPVKVVVFSKEGIGLQKDSSVEISGSVQEYNGKNEIIARKIKVLK